MPPHPAPIPHDETRRLDTLHRYKILDTAPERAFDDIADLAAQICGTPIALVSFVDHERQWFKSHVGLEAHETSREVSFCAHAVLETDVFVVPETHEDKRFATNPLVTGQPKIRFYAGAPLITPEGQAIGTLCVIDREPRDLRPEQKKALMALSRQVVAQLELRRYVAELKNLLGLREDLANMVVHDMRSPLLVILGYCEILGGSADQAIASQIEKIRTQADRLNRMLNDLLAMAKLEEGRPVLDRQRRDVRPLIQEVATGYRVLAESKDIHLRLELPKMSRVMDLDPNLFQRVVDNLVSNAFKFSPRGGTVQIILEYPEARAVHESSGVGLRLRILDEGPGIPEEHRQKVFEKFEIVKSEDKQVAQVGLGLSFCKLVVQEHGGRIEVGANEPRGTMMVVEM